MGTNILGAYFGILMALFGFLEIETEIIGNDLNHFNNIMVNYFPTKTTISNYAKYNFSEVVLLWHKFISCQKLSKPALKRVCLGQGCGLWINNFTV